MMELLTGRCLCGAVAYKCAGPSFRPAFVTASPVAAHAIAWATVPRESFRMIRGELASFASSAPVILAVVAGRLSPIRIRPGPGRSISPWPRWIGLVRWSRLITFGWRMLRSGIARGTGGPSFRRGGRCDTDRLGTRGWARLVAATD